jgi:hypothetical protein
MAASLDQRRQNERFGFQVCWFLLLLLVSSPRAPFVFLNPLSSAREIVGTFLELTGVLMGLAVPAREPSAPKLIEIAVAHVLCLMSESGPRK